MLANRIKGMSLIELMIGLAVVGILFAMGMPNYSIWIQNSRIRNQAESILAGVQMARLEAIKRNTTVEFVLTDSAVTTATAANSLVPNSAGGNWMVRQYRRATDDYVFIQSGLKAQGAKGTNVASTPTTANAITFDGFGRVTTNNDAVSAAPLSRIDVDSTNIAADQSRELRIAIGIAGQIRFCDPNAGSTDPRRCF